MARVILTGFILVPENELEVVQQALIEHLTLTKNEPGCLHFSVTQHRDNPYRYDVYEEFVDKSAFAHHQDRVRNSYWGEVTKNVVRNYTINE